MAKAEVLKPVKLIDSLFVFKVDPNEQEMNVANLDPALTVERADHIWLSGKNIGFHQESSYYLLTEENHRNKVNGKPGTEPDGLLPHVNQQGFIAITPFLETGSG